MDANTTIKFKFDTEIEPSAIPNIYIITISNPATDEFDIFRCHKDDIQWFLSFINGESND